MYQELQMYNENTMIPHPKVPHIHWCIDQVHYRNPHFHDTFEIDYVLNGSFLFTDSVQQFTCHEGDLILVNANEVHEITSEGSSALLFCTQISSSFCHDYFPNFKRTLFSDCRIDQHFSPEARRLLLDRMQNAATAYWEASDDYLFRCVSNSVLILESLLTNVPHQQISTSEYTSRIQTTEMMKEIKNFIQENFAEEALLQKLATHIGFTSTYMSHFFKKYFHISFQQYLMRYRLETAVQMLFSTNMPILDICTYCGFSDYRQLNNYCRTEYGCSARACRKANAINSRSHPSLTPAHPLAQQYLYSDQECLDYLAETGKLSDMKLAAQP